MQILLACAKDMTTRPELSPALSTKPGFLKEAERHARQLATFTEAELEKALKCNARLAILNKLRYLSFFDPGGSGPAVLSYNGMVYRHLRAWEFTEADYAYANNHLWICSFLYGLLRPMDQIRNYRLEGSVKLPDNDDRSMFDFWKPLLTDVLIDSVKQDDGCLVHLATEEMTRLFDWKLVKREVKVVEPQFFIREGDKLKTIVVYTKMCRGTMTHYILRNRLRTREELTAFSYEEFHYQPEAAPAGKDVLPFVLE